MPAQRKHKNRRKRIGSNKTFLIISVLIIAIAGLFLYWFLLDSKFQKDSRFAVTYGSKEKVGIIVFDRESDEITNFIIPNNTRLSVSGGYGDWLSGSIWQLGHDEGMGGMLLATTITKNMHIPVYTWSDPSVVDLSSGEIIRQFKGLRMNSNINIADRFRLAAFALGVKQYGREIIDLSKTQMLSEIILRDGNHAYEVKTVGFQKLMMKAARPEIFEDYPRIVIYDYTGEDGGDEVGELIQAMGGKVANIFYYPLDDDIDCSVWSQHKELSYIVSVTLGCQISEKEKSEGYDSEIVIGGKFSRRY